MFVEITELVFCKILTPVIYLLTVHGNIIVGIVGGFIGYWLLGGRLGEGVVGEILTGTIGASVLLAIVNLFTRGRV